MNVTYASSFNGHPRFPLLPSTGPAPPSGIGCSFACPAEASAKEGSILGVPPLPPHPMKTLVLPGIILLSYRHAVEAEEKDP
jgi:hypothetical protein